MSAMTIPPVDSPDPALLDAPRPVRHPLAPLGYRVYRAIWLANLASNLGSTIQSAAAAWLMTELTPSRTMVALVQASSTLPILLLGVFAGAIADNHDRRLVMIWAQSAMLLASALLAVMGWNGWLTPWSLLALTLAVGIGLALNQPAWQASVRLQADPAVLPQAVALNALSANLARTVGPALGGLLLGIASPGWAFALNALSFVGMVVVLMRWRPDSPERVREPMLIAIRTGLAYCVRSRPLRKVLLRSGAFTTGQAAVQALLPVIASEQVRGTALDYGLMLGAFGFGSIITALFTAGLRRRHGSEAVVGGATVVAVLASAGLAMVTSTGLGMILALLAGSAWIAAMTGFNVAVQLRAPDALLGRCMAIYQAAAFGSMAVSAWWWGQIADRYGTAAAMLGAAAWLALSLPLRLIWPMPARDEGRIPVES